jgi:hypothetical protein
MIFEDASQIELERAAALEAWAAAFDREMVQSGDFAGTVAVMSANGCFDVRGVVERWILTNPTEPLIVPPPPADPWESVPPQAELEEAPALEEVAPPREPASDAEPTPLRPVDDFSPDIAHFHSLLQGGIDREQIYEAFPASRLVIDEAVVQYEAAAPILSEAQTGPSREDLDDEMRRIRQDLAESQKRPRRRWRSRS